MSTSRPHTAALAAVVFFCALSAGSARAQSYTYDAESRLASVTYAGGVVVTYRYDAAGNLCYSGPPVSGDPCAVVAGEGEGEGEGDAGEGEGDVGGEGEGDAGEGEGDGAEGEGESVNPKKDDGCTCASASSSSSSGPLTSAAGAFALCALALAFGRRRRHSDVVTRSSTAAATTAAAAMALVLLGAAPASAKPLTFFPCVFESARRSNADITLDVEMRDVADDGTAVGFDGTAVKWLPDGTEVPLGLAGAPNSVSPNGDLITTDADVGDGDGNSFGPRSCQACCVDDTTQAVADCHIVGGGVANRNGEFLGGRIVPDAGQSPIADVDFAGGFLNTSGSAAQIGVVPVSLNDFGAIVGFSHGTFTPCVFNGSACIALPLPPNTLATEVQVRDINNAGQIVGCAANQPVFWDTNAAPVFLTGHDCRDNFGGVCNQTTEIGCATSINDQGAILAQLGVSTFLFLPNVQFNLPAGRHFVGGLPVAITNTGFIGTFNPTLVVGTQRLASNGRLFTPQEPAPQIPFAATFGGSPWTGSSADPISTLTGEVFVWEEPDIVVDGALPVQFRRSYAAGMDATVGRTDPGPLGPNWRHNYEWSIRNESANRVVEDDRGDVITFVPDGSGGFTMQDTDGVAYQLSDDGLLLYEGSTRLLRTFDAATGQLTSVFDEHGNAITLEYDAGGKLTFALGDDGRGLAFTYEADTQPGVGGRVATVTDGERELFIGYDTGINAQCSSPLSSVDMEGLAATYDINFYSYQVLALTTPRNQPVAQMDGRGNGAFSDFISWNRDAEGRVTEVANDIDVAWTVTYAGLLTTITDAFGDTETHTHDGAALSSIVDDDGTTTIGYDLLGNRSTVDLPDGDHTEISWTPDRDRAAIALPDGTQIENHYVARPFRGLSLDDLAETLFPDGTTMALVHDASGNVTSYTDRHGVSTTFGYDAQGRMTSRTDALGGVSTLTRDGQGHVVVETSARGSVTTHGYDAVGRLVTHTFANGSTEVLGYDPTSGDVLTRTDRRGGVTLFAHDPDDGTLQAVTDEGGARTTFDREVGLVTGVHHPGGGVDTFEYDVLGRMTQSVDRSGDVTTFTYDKKGRLATTTTPLGVTTVEHAKGGEVLSATDPLGGVTSYTHDALGRVLTETSPDGAVTTYEWDVMGNLGAMTDPVGDRHVVLYGADARVQTRRSPGGAELRYAYDAVGQLASVVDPLGGTWSFAHDLDGNATAITDPLGRATGFTVDEMGEVVGVTFPGALGAESVTRDPGGLVTREDYDDGTVIDYTYDARGALLTAGGSTTTGIAMTRDVEGNVASSNGVTFTRDVAGRVTSMTYAVGKTVLYRYGAADLVSEVEDWSGRVTVLTYDALGRITSIAHPNGVLEAFTWSPDSFLLAASAVHGADVVASVALTRDAAGRVETATRTAPSTYEPEALRALGTVDAAHQIARFPHDAMGRRLADDRFQYTWDLADRLTAVTAANDDAVSIEHDAFGRVTHVETSVGAGGALDYVWVDGLAVGRPLVQRVDGADAAYFIALPDGRMLARVDATSDESAAYTFDEAGNTVAMTDDDGAVVWSAGYGPFGTVSAAAGNAIFAQPFTFNGQHGVIDLGDGLFAMGRRVYDAASARFLSKEPALDFEEPRTALVYAYARDNPLLFCDPSGAQPVHIGNTGKVVDPPALTDVGGAIGKRGLEEGLENIKKAAEAIDEGPAQGILSANHLAQLSRGTVPKGVQQAAMDVKLMNQLRGIGSAVEAGSNAVKYGKLYLDLRAKGPSALVQHVKDEAWDKAASFLKERVDKGAGVGLQIIKEGIDTNERVTKITAATKSANASLVDHHLALLAELDRDYRVRKIYTTEEYERLVKQINESFELQLTGQTDSGVAGIGVESMTGLQNMLTAFAGGMFGD